MTAIADAVEGTDAWLHVDGAFGLWAAASPRLRHLVAGIERADSWATDAHKWLNVPYDSGIAFCADPEAHRAAMSVRASYLEQTDMDAARDQMDWVPEFSRRARGFPIYAAIRALGSKGITAMVERCCGHATRFAELLGAEPGVEILNEVVLNQVLVRFGDDDALTKATVKAVQKDGTCWLSGTVWQGKGRDADLGLELAHERRRRRALGGRDPGGRREGRRHGASIVSDVQSLFRLAADYAAQFHDTLDERPVGPRASYDELVEALGGPLANEGSGDADVLSELIAAAEPGLVGSQTGRYFGFVFGSALPASVAADWVASAWDQNGFSVVTSPAAAAAEEVAAGWLAELLGLPDGVSSGFVTGAQGANTTGLAAARQHVLAAAGWDVARDGLAGSPRIRVLAGGERHVTIDRSLRLLGLGSSALELVHADEQGRMRADALRDALAVSGGPAIVCAQAGNVNTGAVDPLGEIADACEAAGAWLHVDGAFGLWAAASPRLQHLTEGCERADSWATDAHKWLNVPYDCGIVFCRHPQSHGDAMAVAASYLQRADGRSPSDWVPESSRRARGFAVWAALRSLGRDGVADLVDRCCGHARAFAELLGAEPGVEILNEVVLNQVLVRFEDDDETTREIVRRVQADGTCWLGGTDWQGRAAMRISVSSFRTTSKDVERSAEAILTAARSVAAAVR